MQHATDTYPYHAAGQPRLAPVPPSIAALSVPERLASVMRRKRLAGQPTTRDDFHQAEETCDLSDGELDANIGAAKRLIHPETVRHDQPPRPIAPWDFDRDYRAERVALAATLVTGTLPGDDVAYAALRNSNFSCDEIAALWPEIMSRVGARHRFAAEPPANLGETIALRDGRARAMDAVRAASSPGKTRVRVVDLGTERRPMFEATLDELGLEDDLADIAAELRANGSIVLGGGAAPAFRLEQIR